MKTTSQQIRRKNSARSRPVQERCHNIRRKIDFMLAHGSRRAISEMETVISFLAGIAASHADVRAGFSRFMKSVKGTH